MERFAETQRLILVTGDRAMANRIHQWHLKNGRRIGCLFLRSLYDAEVRRTAELLSVVEAEHALLGRRFWMEITPTWYRVLR